MRLTYLLRQLWLGAVARSSADYWERRYAAGLTSGSGSYGELARFKADVLNALVESERIASVIEFGCGDGSQLKLARYPLYLGCDVSKTSIDLCARLFRNDATKSFLWYDPLRAINLAAFVRAELALSLDVIYHLLEDRVYEQYLNDVFSIATRYVVIYSSDKEDATAVRHVRHRNFTRDVARSFPQFELIRHIPNPHRDQSFADFYVYRR